MNYLIVLKDGDRYEIDYPCFGFLANLDLSSLAVWSSVITSLDHPMEYGANQPLSEYFDATTVDYVEWIPEVAVPDEILAHPFMAHVKKAGVAIRGQLAGVRCDEAMAPLFMLRDVFGCRGSDSWPEPGLMYNEMVREGLPVWQAFVLSSVWYRGTSYDGSHHYNTRDDDGSLFQYHRVGDVIAMANGAMPEYEMGVFGTYPVGYPAGGATESAAWDDTDAYLRNAEGKILTISSPFSFRDEDMEYSGLLEQTVDEMSTIWGKDNFYDYIRGML